MSSGVLLVATGVMTLWIARLCRSGTLEPNSMIGIRTPITLSSREAWIAAHHAAAPGLSVAGAVMFVAGAALAVATPSQRIEQASLAIVGGAVVASVAAAAIIGHRAATRVPSNP